jgi:hypothetical protein
VDWEEKMKRFWTILLAGLVLVAITAPAFAWEFQMKGEYEYRLNWFSRTGGTDLFGVAAIENSPGGVLPGPAGTTASRVGLAGPTFYGTGLVGSANASNGAAVRITRGGFSQYESDAFYNDSRMTFVPTVRVNPAIRLHGVYTIGGYRNRYNMNGGGAGVPSLERYYMSQVSDNAYDTAAVGSWEQFRATVQLPYGVLSIGAKDFPLGTGATTAFSTRSESFLLVLPYGPIRMLPAVWLARSATADGWNTTPDAGRKPTVFNGFIMTYDSGPCSLGAGVIWQQLHQNAAFAPNGALGQPGTGGYDRNLLFWEYYFKYNNGRFMLAAEYSYATLDHYFLGRDPALIPAASTTSGPRYLQSGENHREYNHWFIEAGAVAGPAKLRLLYAGASGPVLNNNNPTKDYQNYGINYQAMQPYEFLMFNTYGGGNQNFSNLLLPNDGHGMMGDAYCFAGRADYAVASNLNVYGSYLWAHRLEVAGSYAGGILSSGAAGASNIAAAQNWKALNGFGPNANPYVDDGFIGWEANAGVEWKLLEGMNMFVRYSYWQPGGWFNQAYQAVGYRGGVAVSDAYVQGRDAIQALQGSFLMTF